MMMMGLVQEHSRNRSRSNTPQSSLERGHGFGKFANGTSQRKVTICVHNGTHVYECRQWRQRSRYTNCIAIEVSGVPLGVD